MKARILAALILLAAMSARPSDEPVALDDTTKWGQPYKVVPPEYPKSALAARTQGFVDVTGVVNGVHRLAKVSYRTESREADVFVPALEEVITYWHFNPPLGGDCRPASTPITVRVWFELEDQKPKISVSRARSVDPPGVKGLTSKAVDRVPPRFPEEALRRGSEGANVFTRVSITQDGAFASVETKAFPENSFARHFEKETARAIKQWRVRDVAEGDLLRGRMACVEIQFRLTP